MIYGIFKVAKNIYFFAWFTCCRGHGVDEGRGGQHVPRDLVRDVVVLVQALAHLFKHGDQFGPIERLAQRSQLRGQVGVDQVRDSPNVVFDPIPCFLSRQFNLKNGKNINFNKNYF